MSLSAVPLDLAPILRQLLFDRLDTVVLTSATLAAGGEFDFLESRLGLSGEDVPVKVREMFASPSTIRRSACSACPTICPSRERDEPAHGPRWCRW